MSRLRAGKTAAMLLAVFLLSGAGMLAAWLLIGHIKATFNEIIFVEGIIMLMLGFASMIHGNPRGVHIDGNDKSGADRSLNGAGLEAMKLERRITDFYNKFTMHSVIKFAYSGITLVLAGFILAAASYII